MAVFVSLNFPGCALEAENPLPVGLKLEAPVQCPRFTFQSVWIFPQETHPKTGLRTRSGGVCCMP